MFADGLRRAEGLRRAAWAALSTVLRWTSKGAARVADPPISLAEWAKDAAVAAHFRSLPDPPRSSQRYTGRLGRTNDDSIWW